MSRTRTFLPMLENDCHKAAARLMGTTLSRLYTQPPSPSMHYGTARAGYMSVVSHHMVQGEMSGKPELPTQLILPHIHASNQTGKLCPVCTSGT